MKLFEIEDYTKEDGQIILFCKKKELEFEIKFGEEKYINWLKYTDRMSVSEITYYQGAYSQTISAELTEHEYWGNFSYLSICEDLYEYVVLKLVAPHKLFNGTETALLTILNSK